MKTKYSLFKISNNNIFTKNPIKNSFFLLAKKQGLLHPYGTLAGF